jgi:hypothetical protein
MSNVMKPSKRLCITLFLAWLVSVSCPAQSIFQTTLLPPLGETGFPGRAYIQADAANGQFQIDFLNTSPPADLIAIIGGLGQSVTIPLGTGTPDSWSNDTGDLFPDPFLPPPPFILGSPLDIRGTQYNGTFQSSPALFAVLLLGHGQIHLIADGTGYGGGGLNLVAIPEPGDAALLSCGLVLFLIPALRKRYAKA